MRPNHSFATSIRWINRICLPILALIIVGVVWSRFVSGPSPLSTPDRMGDFSMDTQMAKAIFDGRQYPANFAYPLPGVLLWHSLTAFGFSVGALAWLVILPASLIGCLVLSERLIREQGTSLAGLTVAVAFAAVNYFVVWDLHATNINSFYLFLVLLAARCWQKDKPTWAGILFGASVAVKMYSIVFLLYLLFRREWRMGLAMVCTLLVSFFALPLLVFGWHDTVHLTGAWMRAMAGASRPAFWLSFPAYKVSWAWTALLLLNPAASDGKFNLLNWSPEAVALAVKAACFAWALLVVAYFTSAWRRDAGRARRPLAFGLDISILLLLPLPASPFLQPHHLVVLLVPAVCFMHAALDETLPARLRWIAGLAVALGFCLTDLVFRSSFRGVGVMGELIVYLIGLWILRLAACSRLESPGNSGNSSNNAIQRTQTGTARMPSEARKAVS